MQNARGSKAMTFWGQTQELQNLLNFYHGTDDGKTNVNFLQDNFRSLNMIMY